MVRIAGFHPADPGSIPGVEKLKLHIAALNIRTAIIVLAHLVERETFHLEVVGSIPTYK